MRQKKKAGFSMTEVVIAMAVVVIVSIASATVLKSSTTVAQKTISQTTARNFAANAVECFKVAPEGDTEAYKNLLTYAIDGTPIAYDSANSSENTYYYRQEDRFVAEITVDSGTIKITVKDNHEKEIIALTYTKGGSQ